MRFESLLTLLVLSGVALRSAAEEPPAPDAAPASGMQVKVFTVRNGDATSRAEMLRLVLGQGSSGVRPLQIVAETRTNSIVAVGAAGDLEIIRALLARLENPLSYRLQPMPQPAPKPAAEPVR